MHNNNLPAAPGAALILLCGLPGAGKTTFARALARELPIVHLESDAVRSELFPTSSYSPSESAQVFAVIEQRAARCLAAGKRVLVDATNLREAHRRRFLAVADRALAPRVIVRLVAPEDTTLRRLARPRTGFSEAGEDVYQQLRSQQEPGRETRVVVDTRFPIAPSLALVAELVKSPR
jgi:hypothetical protein